MPPREFLKRRNALWQRLRALSEADTDDARARAEFEAALTELSGLIGWDRQRVLAGLGLTGLGLAELRLTGPGLSGAAPSSCGGAPRP